LLPKHKKYVRFMAKTAKTPNWVTIRQWLPPNAEVDQFWNEPLRAIFTFWVSGCHPVKAWGVVVVEGGHHC
jgi:hypothetical protein